MLRYLGTGWRRFGLHPMYVHRRVNWEFCAVLDGRCGAVVEGQSTTLRSRHLWLFPPDTAHGWAGAGPETCEVAVFHFGHVPDLLQRQAGGRAWLDRPLNAAQVRQIRQMAADLQPHYERMTGKSLLVFERALLDLALLMLEDVPGPADPMEGETGVRKVEAALAWHAEHMSDQPKVDVVARAVHMSVRHLRRLFQVVRDESPLDAFTRQRLHRAMELLAHTPARLDEVARQCGFASTSDFCRVFQAHQKTSPGAWRRRLPQQCSTPGGLNPAVAAPPGVARVRKRKGRA